MPRASSAVSMTKSRHKVPCPTARSDQVRPWFRPTGYQGRHGANRRYPHTQGPCVSGFDQGWKSGICANPIRQTAPATCDSPPWSKSPTRRGVFSNPAKVLCRSFLRPIPGADHSCWPDQNETPHGQRHGASWRAGFHRHRRRQSSATGQG